VLTAFVDLLGPPLTIFFTARWEAKRMPWIQLTPKPVADHSPSDAPSARLAYFGYEFEVPWSGKPKIIAFGKGGIVELQFETGQKLAPSAPANQNALFTEAV
jgi:hypothetical protein